VGGGRLLLRICVFDDDSLNAVEASNVLPISAGTSPVPVADRESRLSLLAGWSAMHRGRVRKRLAPRLIHRARSRVLASMLLLRLYGYQPSTSNVLCLSVSVNRLSTISTLISLTYFPGSSSLRSFMPGGLSQVPAKKPNPVFASLNSPGRRPENSLLMNLACMPFGRKYDEGKRYQSLPKQTASPRRATPGASSAW
jgi:hypothetical protein